MQRTRIHELSTCRLQYVQYVQLGASHKSQHEDDAKRPVPHSCTTSIYPESVITWGALDYMRNGRKLNSPACKS